jgi:hypothetical protein
MVSLYSNGGMKMEMFAYELPLGSIGQLKTGDVIEQGVVVEIHFVGLNENKLVITGIVNPHIVFKEGDKVIHSNHEEYGVGVVLEVRNTTAWVKFDNGIKGAPHLKSLVKLKM